MVMDSLRYWVTEMHVDGFRFDLAPTLGRHRRAAGAGGHGTVKKARLRPKFDREAPFFQAVRQDPVLSRVKLIAEPWDIGPGGYQVGEFPSGWSEWTTAIEKFAGPSGSARAPIGATCRRACGLGRPVPACRPRPQASVNYVTAHDGFTLHDVVS